MLCSARHAIDQLLLVRNCTRLRLAAKRWTPNGVVNSFKLKIGSLMPTPSDTCPKCQATMSDGFVVTPFKFQGLVSAWHPGPVIKSIWWGFKVRRAEMRQITANRCERCGFLEFYAP